MVKTDMQIADTARKILSSRVFLLFWLWLAFSLMYWYAAWNKPFHVDEFYSWVYAHRCSFLEILMLKDDGIGHPPLYHLLQKIVQSVFGNYHFLQVRLVNYIAATFYVLSLAVLVYRFRKSYMLCLGVCLSATVFELFLFSRMYGVLSLMALWAYCLAEKYIDTENKKYMLLLFLVVIAGFFSDYNFILMAPCVVIALLWRARHGGKIIFTCFVIAVVLLLFTSSYRIVHSGVQSVWGAMRFTVSDTARVLLETIYLMLNFTFKELLAAGILIFLGALFVSIPKNRVVKLYRNIGKKLLEACQRLMTFLKRDDYFIRLMLSLIGAYLVLLAINPLFSLSRRDLIDKRFLFLLFPLLLFLLIKYLPLKVLKILSVMWILSGVLFIFSSRIQNYYPPSTLPVNQDMHGVFFNEFSYSTQYLKIDHKTGEEPEFIDPLFRSFCRVCAMGRVLNFDDRRNTIAVMGDEGFSEAGIMPEGYVLVEKYLFMSRLDAFLFKYLTPMSGGRFGIYIYQNSEYSN